MYFDEKACTRETDPYIWKALGTGTVIHPKLRDSFFYSQTKYAGRTDVEFAIVKYYETYDPGTVGYSRYGRRSKKPSYYVCAVVDGLLYRNYGLYWEFAGGAGIVKKKAGDNWIAVKGFRAW
jgi:hypothetical protein